MSITVTMQLHVGADDVADWASRRGGDARSRTARMLMTGAENREARDEVLIRLHDLRGSIEAIREGVHGPSLPETRTHRARIGYGSPAIYRGLLFVQRNA